MVFDGKVVRNYSVTITAIMIDVEIHVPLRLQLQNHWLNHYFPFLDFCTFMFAWIVSLPSFIWIAFM